MSKIFVAGLMARGAVPDFPMPRYRKGDVVYRGWVDSTKRQHPCPDCLGTGKWSVTTPAGETHSMGCQRCGNRYASRETPSLEYFEHVPSIRRLTIGSIRIETDRSWDRADVVQYMCVETGVGSGSVYDERDLYPTEADAQAAAQIQCNVKNAELAATPERIRQKYFHEVMFKLAETEASWESVWNAWWAYRHLREDLEGFAKDLQGKSDKEALEDILRYEREYRAFPPLGRLLIATKAALDGDMSKLQAAYAAFPEIWTMDIPTRSESA